MNQQELYRHNEKIYKITIDRYNRLMSQMITRINAGQYGKHMISNIYFDTPRFDLIRTSLDNTVYQEKLYLRSYGAAKETDLVYIELQKKLDGIVYKQRIPMMLSDARKYLYYGIAPADNSQVLSEVDDMIKRYELKPRVYLAHERIAFYGKDDPDLQITFDMNIRARENNIDLNYGTYGIPLLEKGTLLMEIKVPTAIPAWLSRMLTELEIYPVSYSKYGTYYQEYAAAATAA